MHLQLFKELTQVQAKSLLSFIHRVIMEEQLSRIMSYGEMMEQMVQVTFRSLVTAT